jgi:hypothetical protein
MSNFLGCKIKKEMYRIIVLSIFVIILTSDFSHDIEVKEFEPLEKDYTAVMSPKKDINGNALDWLRWP